MATWTTSNAVGEREDLSDVITRIDPDETPIYSNLPKATSSAVLTEWQVQELASASTTASLVSEGADATYVNPQATQRLSNYHQINARAAKISGTLDAVDKAGRDRETAYAKVLKALELRRDIEKTIVSDQAKTGSGTRKAGTLRAWITNIADNGGTAPTGDGSDVYTDATATAALTVAKIDEAMQEAYEDGGQPNMMSVSPTNKKVFSDLNDGTSGQFLMSNQYNQTSPTEAVMIGSVSMYLSDFGRLDVTIDRFQANDRIFLLDTDFAQICTLPGRNFFTEDLAKSGDAQKFQIITEWSMIVQAPKAHGAIYDLSGA